MTSPKEKFTVVILAAGMGTRLGELTRNSPKALTPVLGKPILHYSLTWAQKLKPQKIVVVGGYLFDQLRDAALDIHSEAIVVQNEDYKNTQRLVSLLRARPHIAGGLAVYDGDYIYHPIVAEAITRHLSGVVIFGTKDEHPYEKLDMMVRVDENNRLLDMSKNLTDYQYYFNSFLYVGENFVSAFFDAAMRTIERLGPEKSHVEDALLEYARTGGSVRFVNLGKPLWIEIDNPEELAGAERMIKTESKRYL